jgi:hypothetical protein
MGSGVTPSRQRDEPPFKSLSRASSGSSGSERSRMDSIRSKISRRSEQGEFTAIRAQSRTAISRGQKATTWESSDEESEEEGTIYDPSEAQRRGYVTYTLTLNKRKWEIKKREIKIDKENKIKNITIKNINIMINNVTEKKKMKKERMVKTKTKITKNKKRKK